MRACGCNTCTNWHGSALKTSEHGVDSGRPEQGKIDHPLPARGFEWQRFSCLTDVENKSRDYRSRIHVLPPSWWKTGGIGMHHAKHDGRPSVRSVTKFLPIPAPYPRCCTRMESLIGTPSLLISRSSLLTEPRFGTEWGRVRGRGRGIDRYVACAERSSSNIGCLNFA